jgi:hypothetical protein
LKLKIEIIIFLNLKIFIFEIWNENLCLIFLKISHITKWKWKNNWNEEIIYFVYATEIKLPMIPPIPPMHTTLYHMCKLW